MKKSFDSVFTITIIALFGTMMFMCRDYAVYNLVYIFSFLFIACHTVFMPSKILSKAAQMLVYSLVMVSQILMNTLMIRTMEGEAQVYNLCRLLGVLAAAVPFMIRGYFFYQSTERYVFPSQEEHSVISYLELLYNKEDITAKIEKLRQAGCVLSRLELTEIMSTLSRHNSFAYINHGTLTEAYFQKVLEELENGYVYIVVTKTKSVPSDVIGLFTNKEYNHVSLAFDKDLKTIISYNGGNRAIPPGLNAELLETLTQKNGSAVMVYRLPATTEQKSIILEKIRKINREGSAYNLLGLVFKTSAKPNIMFCSQFVYTLLKLAGLNYFEKKAARVTPSDFIELDYERKLEFVDRIALDHVN